MSKLNQVLKNHGIDATNVEALLGSGPDAVHGLCTTGAAAVDLWRRLRTAAGEIGYWPVILGGAEDLNQHNEAFRMMSEEAGRGSVMDIIAAGAKVDVTEWLTARAAGTEAVRPVTTGVWPAGDLATHYFTLPMNNEGGSPLPRVYVGLVPTVIGWQVPAFLRFGGWNGCPSPEYHVAMLKYWRNAYGAEIVSLGGNVLEAAVARPPADRASAMRLAREQFVYCPDMVRAGSQSLEVRAAMLLGATAWSFWWE